MTVLTVFRQFYNLGTTLKSMHQLILLGGNADFRIQWLPNKNLVEYGKTIVNRYMPYFFCVQVKVPCLPRFWSVMNMFDTCFG